MDVNGEWKGVLEIFARGEINVFGIREPPIEGMMERTPEILLSMSMARDRKGIWRERYAALIS